MPSPPHFVTREAGLRAKLVSFLVFPFATASGDFSGLVDWFQRRSSGLLLASKYGALRYSCGNTFGNVRLPKLVPVSVFFAP